MATGYDGRKDKFSNLIHGTVVSLQKNVRCEKAANIQKAVAACINIFLADLAKEEPMFKHAELIQVGSYAEGTKILEPDEFDLLVVIDELSRPGAVAIGNDPEKVQGYTHLPDSGYVTLAVADDNLKTKWERYCKNGLLQCFQSSETVNRTIFGSIFMKIIRKLYKERGFTMKKDNVIMCTFTEIDFVNCAIRMPPVNGIALSLRRVRVKYPNVLIDFELDDLKIGVDLCPAIRYHKITDCFKPEDCAGSALSEAILRRESLLFVANINFDFRVTVTEAEVDYIQRIMKHEHKVIYIFLKYINYLVTEKNGGWGPFSSYMLKNICLRHDVDCKLEPRTTSTCFLGVLEDIDVCCSKSEIKSVVNSRLNLSLSAPQSERIQFEYRLEVIEVLSQISQQALDVHTFEDFKELINSKVEKCLKGFRHRLDETSLFFYD